MSRCGSEALALRMQGQAVLCAGVDCRLPGSRGLALDSDRHSLRLHASQPNRPGLRAPA
ncbi:hypothetical protein LEMLEM_LOCUS21961 [Lemmus lemmus]